MTSSTLRTLKMNKFWSANTPTRQFAWIFSQNRQAAPLGRMNIHTVTPPIVLRLRNQIKRPKTELFMLLIVFWPQSPRPWSNWWRSVAIWPFCRPCWRRLIWRRCWAMARSNSHCLRRPTALLKSWIRIWESRSRRAKVALWVSIEVARHFEVLPLLLPLIQPRFSRPA